MKYSLQVEKAIRFAAVAHNEQYRKEHEFGPLPYVSHVFTVAMIVSEHTDDEDVVIAALLHDIIEDTEYAHEDLAKEFSVRVADLVETVSECSGPQDKKRSWRERKSDYIEKIQKGDTAALLISASDKIHNMHSKHRIHTQIGSAFIDTFSAHSLEYVWYHGEVLRILQDRMPEHSLTQWYEELYKEETNRFA